MATSAAFKVEAAVIGAGVIGLSIARALAMAGKEVIILDRASSVGSETSSRNSEVIHAGLYYPAKSFKAQFCVKGKHMLYDYCRSRDIPFKNCGKLIVATQKDQLDTKLRSLQQQAIQNGVDDVKIITQQDIKHLEPNLHCVGALWSPSTGVIDSHSFMLNLLADAEKHGATLALQSSIASKNEILHKESKPQKSSLEGILLQVDDAWLECKLVVNSAGLWAHHVADTIHKHNNSSSESWNIPQQYFAKGNYFKLQGCKAPFHRLIYPLPEPGGLGIHATIDWSGHSVKFGPDVEWIHEASQPEDVDLRPVPTRSESFYEEIRKYWPQLPDEALVPDYAGLRPKLYHPSVPKENNSSLPFYDFLIQMPEDHGIPGLIHLFGMESPGLTSSMAVGAYIAQEVKRWE